jgi:predicted GNAT family N-acyltransferase
LREFHAGDEYALAKMIKEVFDEFVAPDYSAEGNEFFYSFVLAEKIAERAANGNIICCAVCCDEIVGMIEVRDNFHICLLFVKKENMRNGIAGKLFEKVIEQIRLSNDCIKFIEVNASPYSLEIYKKLGFSVTGDIRETNGIKYIPMVFRIDPK